MPQQISKKITIYIILFTMFGTVTNKYLSGIKFPKINEISISGIEGDDKEDILSKLQFLKSSNLIFLKKSIIKLTILSNKNVETFSIFKKYPSTLEIEVKKAKILAKIKIEGIDYLIASNGELIKKKKIPKSIPQLFGKPNVREFLKLKKIIDNSKFNYKDIKSLFFYPSKRWDIETLKGTYVKLPKDQVKQSLILLDRLMKDNNFKNLKIIDLRQNNQLVTNEQ